MQKLLIVTLLVLVSSGFVLAYMMYRQLGTETVMLEGAPALEVSGDGAACGEVSFNVGARSLGRWLYEVGKGQTIAGTVKVGGNESMDVDFGIYSPTNRSVYDEPGRTNEEQFEVVGTIRGNYRFEFDNRYSALTGKDVTLSFCVT